MNIWGKISIFISSTLLLSSCSILDRKNVAGLQVITNDTSSSLFLDGQYLDKTPYINRAVKPGEYTLKIQPDNQELISHETQISLRRGALTVITWKPGNKSENSGGIIYEMEEIKSSQGELSFITIPNNSIIRFDQGEQQFSPLILRNIEPGHHQFEISLPSYEKQQHTINVIKGYRINITAKLAKTDPPEERASPLNNNVLIENDVESTQSGSNSGQLVTIEPTGFYQNETEVLKVRQEASSSAAIIGHALVNQSYPYLGETLAGWLKIEFDNRAGWVSDQYTKLTNE
jgi:SH3 domain-containing protein/PEGA domain-containing protein